MSVWNEVKWWEALEWASKNADQDFQYRDDNHTWKDCKWGAICASWLLKPKQMFEFDWRIPMEVGDE